MTSPSFLSGLVAGLGILAASPLGAQTGLPVISVSPVRVMEGDAGEQTVLVPVFLSAAAAGPVSVNWAAVNGTAAAGTDFTAAGGTLTFAAGETRRTVSVTVQGDGTEESDEFFSLMLTGPAGAVTGAGTARVLIQNDELFTLVRLPAALTLFERNVPGLFFPEALAGNPGPGRLLPLFLTGGTATAGGDVTLAVPAMGLSGPNPPVPVRAVDDAAVEADESFTLTAVPASPAVKLLPGRLVTRLPAAAPPSGMDLDDGLLAAVDETGVRLYRRAAGQWQEEAVLSGPADGGVSSVALDQGVVAADFFNAGIRIFTRTAEGWAPQALIPRSPAPSGSRRRVALSDDVLAVGEPADTGSGTVRIYVRHFGGFNAWGLRQTLSPAAVQPDFGSSVSLWGNLLVTGAPGSGQAHLYRMDPATAQWSLLRNFVHTSFDFGRHCLVDGGTVLVADSASAYLSRRARASDLTWSDAVFTAIQSTSSQAYALNGPVVGVRDTYYGGITLHVSTGDGGLSGVPVVMENAAVSGVFALNGDDLVVSVADGQGGHELQFFGPLDRAAGTIIDDESIQISATEVSLMEGTSTGYASLLLSRPLPVAVSVLCTTVDGTAKAGLDYEWSSTWVTIPAGATSAAVYVKTLGDVLKEGAETFFLQLEMPTFGTAGPPAEITVTDPPPPEINLTEAAVTVPEGGQGLTPVAFTVLLSHPAAEAGSFQWVLENGTAVSGSDFPPEGAAVVIPAGETMVTFEVAVLGDAVCEPDETLTLRLFNPSGLQAGPASSCLITLANDDAGEPQPDHYTVRQNGVLSGRSVRENDCMTQPVSLARPAAHGTLILDSSGSFIYTPQANFTGTDQFAYHGGAGGGSLDGVDLVTPASLFRWFNPLNGIDPNSTNPAWNTGWYQPSWNDAAWGTGFGLMGYGQMISSQGNLSPDTDIGTPASGMRRTAYFRHRFMVTQAGTYNLDLSISRDDAAIVYLNGVEAVRSHEAGAVNVATKPDTWDLMVEGNSTAWTAGVNEGDPYLHHLSGIHLHEGLNTLAISGHNGLNPTAPTSSDLGIKVFYLRVISGTAELADPVPVTIQVSDAQQPPLLTPDAFTLTEDRVFDSVAAASVFANDGLFDGGGTAYDPLLGAEVLEVQNGAVTAWNAQTGHFVFTPDPDFSGTASFRYRVRDKDGWSQPAAVTFTVAADLTLSALSRAEPAGSRLFRSVSSLQFPAGRPVDDRVALKAGQTISLRAAVPGITGLPEVRGPDGAALSGGTAGLNSLENVPVPADGIYTVAVAPAGAGSGTGTLTMLLNGGLPGAPVDPLRPADLDAARPAGIPRAAVAAVMPASGAQPHHFGFAVSAGETVQLYLHADTAVPFTLFDDTGTKLADSSVSSRAAAASRLTWTFARAGRCRVQTGAVNNAAYTLQLYREGATHEDAAAVPPPAAAWSAGYLQGPGGSEPGVTFAAFGDYGSGSSNEAAVAAMVKSWNPAFLISTGDNNYTSGIAAGSPAWTTVVGNFYGAYIPGREDQRYPEQTASRPRFFPVPGNHDSGPDSSNGGELSGYLDYFYANPGGTPRLPGGVFQNNLTYYAMQWENMEFYFIDSDNAVVNSAALTAQRQWLRARLDASTARWKFAVWHHPPYSSSAIHGNHPAMQWGADLQGLTALFTGHDHIYERLDAGFGVTQFITGLGGAGIYPLGTAVPQSVVRYNGGFGAMKIQAGQNGVKCDFITTGGALIDSWTTGTPPGESAPGGADTWALRVHPGQILRLSTTTPAPPGSLTSTVNPAIEVRDANGALMAADAGSAPDGLNAALQLTVPDLPGCPPEGCLWTVLVRNEGDGAGEYVLHGEAPPPAEYYALWAGAHLPADAREQQADPDGDGAPNLMEFLASTGPVTASPEPPLTITAASGPAVVHLHLPDSWTRPVSVQLQRASQLAEPSWQTVASRGPGAAWAAAPGEPVPVPAPGGGFTFSDTAAERRFYRFRFIMEPE